MTLKFPLQPGDSRLNRKLSLRTPARQLAAGVAPEDLRGDGNLRGAWARELGQIETTLTSMVIDKPTRRITFED